MSPLRHSLAALAALGLAPLFAAALLHPKWRVGLSERLGVRPRARGDAGADAGAVAGADEVAASGAQAATNDSAAKAATDGTAPRRPADVRTRPAPVWLHGASVGEISAALPLVDALHARPGGVHCSCTTLSGRDLLCARRPAVPVRLAPVDHPWAVRRALGAVSPSALVLMETELWPAWIRAAACRGAPVLLLSARLSERSFSRYRKFARWLAPTFRRIAAIGARSEADAARFEALGALPGRIELTGDLKFEIPQSPASPSPELERRLGAAPLLVAGSTHEGEEAAALAALEALLQRGHPAALVLAPRHPQRFERAAHLVRAAGRRLLRRSQPGAPLAAGEVLLLDSIGELPGAWTRARAAFVGGSLTPRGGHNLLEPAFASVPVIFGPHTENTAEAASLLKQHGAGIEVRDAAALADAACEVFAGEQQFRERSRAFLAALEAHRGAASRSLALLDRVLAAHADDASRTPGTSHADDASRTPGTSHAGDASRALGASHAGDVSRTDDFRRTEHSA